MRRTIRLFAIPLLVLGFSFVWAGVVSAQASDVLSPEQVERVRVNCISIKSAANQLHASDGLLRVNRGQMYVSMASSLMDRFNDRLSSNGLDNKAMTAVTASYRSAFTTFYNDYIKYEQKLSEALRIDCNAKPAEFFSALQDARKLRATVHEDVKKLHQYIDDYRTSVDGFLTNFERLSD